MKTFAWVAMGLVLPGLAAAVGASGARPMAGRPPVAPTDDGAPGAAPLRLPAVKDNSIVLVEGEWRDNAGDQPRLRIKGNQHLVAMQFDTSALRGRRVASAELVCRKADAEIAGLTISTLAAEWDEHKSNALSSGRPGDGWGYAGARFPAVCGGNGFTLVCQAPSEVRDGAYRWRVEPDLVHALAVGAAYGLALHEFSCDYSRNPTIFSREQSGRGPYLEVTFAPAADEPAPAPPTLLRVTGDDAEGLHLALRAPAHGFAYEVAVDGRPLGRWNTPFVRPGEVQTIPIRDVPLVPGAAVKIAVVTINRLGQRSAPATVSATVPAPKAIEYPAPSPPSPLPQDVGASGARPVVGRPPVAPTDPGAPAGLTVIPVADKYDAAGRPVGDLPPDYRGRNAVFDGRTVRLSAARGEVVSFQALVRRPSLLAPDGNRGSGAPGRVTVTCSLPGLRVDLWRAVYVACEGGRRIPDPLVPLGPGGEVPLAADEATPIIVDVFVPFDFKTLQVAGALGLSDGRQVPVQVEVRPFALPRAASFLCEMNGYGLPDKTSEFYRLQEIAYDHRVHVNLLAYSHRTAAPGSRQSNMDMVMDMEMGSGALRRKAPDPLLRRMDEKRYNAFAPGATHGTWDDFAAVFGPHLSGDGFARGHRGPVPAPGFYLTFHESWPLHVREFFSGSPDAFEAFRAHPEYAQTFVNVLRDFLAVSGRQGWARAGFQVYLNNKGSLKDPAKAPWILDEPADYWDYRALAFYGRLVKQAREGLPRTGLAYRIDISRPEFDRGQLAGVADLWVVSTDAFHHYGRLLADRVEREGLKFWIYGTTNKVERTNRTVEAWVLDACRGGASGLVPWQTLNTDGSAMTKADPLGLFIFTGGGADGLRHSMRLKAYRDAEQLVEYLELVRTKRGLTPGQVRAFIDHYVDLGGAVPVASAEDAGTPEYGRATPEALRQLREAAATLLAAP